MKSLTCALLMTGVLLAGPAHAAVPDSLKIWLHRPGQADSTRVKYVLARVLHFAEGSPEMAQAPRMLLAALALARRSGYVDGELRILQDLGDLKAHSSDFAAAHRYFTQGLNRCQQTGQTRHLAGFYARLGNVVFEEQDFEQAVGLFQKAVASAEAHGQVGRPLAVPLGALAMCYLKLGQPGPARRAFRRALATNRAIHDRLAEFQALAMWGEGLRTQQPDSAAHYLQLALKLAGQLHDSYAQAYASLVLMQVRKQQGQWLAVQQLAIQTLRYARQSQTLDYEQEALAGLAASLRHQGQGAAAYDTLTHAQALLDSLWGQEKQAELSRLQVRYEVSEKEARIKGLEQARRIARLRAAQQQARTRFLTAAAVTLATVALGIGLLLGLVLRQRRRLQVSETKLREANKTKDQLIRIVGHDLRSPMASLQQLTPLLHEVIEQPERSTAHALIRTLDAGAQHLGNMVDNLFQWARAQGGQLINNPERLRTSFALGSIAALYAPTAQLKNISLTTTTPPELQVWADLGLLTAVLRNLASNALKFSPKGGSVQLTAEAMAAGVVEFSITDSGPGIAPDHLRELLTADRLPSTPGSNGEPGTGLGLPLSARFVRMMGGELHLEPRPEGGTRAWFRLPEKG